SDSNYIACGGYPAVRSDCDTYWDGCIRKVSKDGDLMWERFYRMFTYYRSDGLMRFYSTLTSIIPDHGSDIMILGSSYGHYPQQRGFLMKTDSVGRIKWCRHYYAIDSLTRGQYLVSMQPTSDNGFILAGYGNDYDTHGYFPSQQAWLVKTDSLGIDGLCYTAPPELNIDIVLPATVNCSDTITVYAYIAGKSAPYTIETSIGQIIDSIYYPPLFVPVEIGLSEAEIDCGGNIIYTQQITEATLSNHEWGQCIAKPVEFYTPHFSGSQQITIMVTDAYGESKTITKEVFINDNCGSGIGGEEVNSVNVYPNPAVDNLYLDLAELVSSTYFGSAQHKPLSHQSLKCEIYNSVGQLVETVQLSNNLTVINVKDFASGVYQIKITEENGNVLVRGFEKL
ncbi:MAG: T9SS type A sorting domain-containing protein, partial [Bacteroidales bacterium]|nr:T9SS type A sorting domain-containing protein [Bacteroidales bacterium]